jgi:hypothetical protein
MGNPKPGNFYIDLLYQIRPLGCAKPRDRIGFLGSTNFKPGYSLTVSETYHDFARCIIEHSGNLDIWNYKREWRNVEPVALRVYAHSMIDQASTIIFMHRSLMARARGLERVGQGSHLAGREGKWESSYVP